MKKNTPVFFKKVPKRLDCEANAEYLRDLGTVGGEEVCEIARWPDMERWIVKRSEIKDERAALDEIVQNWEDEIVAAKERNQTKAAWAAKIGISPGTLRRRLRLIKEREEWRKLKNGKLVTGRSIQP